jgi:hypothetical protein
MICTAALMIFSLFICVERFELDDEIGFHYPSPILDMDCTIHIFVGRMERAIAKDSYV